ncbi:MAG: hypothetical protein IJ037_12555 [Clostridia bacterium]|nr:hypothetical protein [Clostridia bacterium]
MKKTVFAVLCLILCLFCVVSCSDESVTEETAAAAEPAVLTNVFRSSPIEIPDGYMMHENIAPYYDAESGELTILLEPDWDAAFTGYVLLTCDSDGNVLRQTDVPLSGEITLSCGALTADSLYYVSGTYDRETSVYSYIPGICSLTDGTIVTGQDIAPLFRHPDGIHSRVTAMTAAPDGTMLIGTYCEILLLDSNFVSKTSLFASSGEMLYSLHTAPDGTAYAVFDCFDSFKASSVDIKSGSYGRKISLPANTSPTGIYFGEGYDVFLTDADGLYGYTSGDEAVTLLLDYANTGLYQAIADIRAVLSPDRVFMLEQDPSTGHSHPTIYRRSADIDLAEIRTVEIAYLNAKYNFNQKVLEFNKDHPDVRVIIVDYSVYKTDENPEGGWRKLITDMKTGIFKPDAIVTGNYGDNTEFLSAVYHNGLWTDLYPFLDSSDKVSRDDLLGCVKRTYESENGELWAIGYDLTMTTLVGKTEIIGDAGGWTLSEVLDLAESLPQGSELLRYISQSEAHRSMLGSSGYAQFIDMENHTCDFTSGEFVRYLHFLKTLSPEPPYGNTDSSDTYYLNYISGSTPLLRYNYSSVNSILSLEGVFGTKDLNLIGFPSRDSYNGTQISMFPFIITPFSDNPEDAWEFIEGVITEMSIHTTLPAFKSLLSEKIEHETSTYYNVRYGGGAMIGGSSIYDPENPPAEPREGYFRTFFTEEDGAWLMNMLDNVVGEPLRLAVDGDVTDLINEEISAFLSGARSAEECADIVQSRVSLWLEEHK